MARHAIVNSENKVVNVIIWNGESWLPPRNHTVVHCVDDKCDIGDNYDPLTNSFSKYQQGK